MAKRIGAVDRNGQSDIKIECLEGFTPEEQVEKIAESFAAISNEYDPVDLKQLPSYLPHEKPPELSVYKVCLKIQKQKNTKSTLEIDIPDKLRKEAAAFIAEPLTHIYNSCLREGTYPKSWKMEWVTPVPKGKPGLQLKQLKDVRKIASTSDYSKIVEHFILEFILEDISDKLSKQQYGGKKGVGTEHLLVSLIDRIKKVLDDPGKCVVVLCSYDWSAAFDRLDPTKVTLKCIKLGIRSSIVKVLIDFLKDRKMKVKFNQQTSSLHDLTGGSPQGSILGQLLYIIGSDDAVENLEEDDKYQYIDDVITVENVNIENKLHQYDVWNHVPSDIPTQERFLAPHTFESQNIINNIALWTEENKAKLNVGKSKYMIFSKSKEQFTTRLSVNHNILDRENEMIHLGLWISQDLSWEKHISEVCKKTYPKLKMLTKLKYVGIRTEDLIELYCSLIRSQTEYCSTVFHSSLSQRLSNKLENIQRTSLKVILGVMYVDYQSALEMCGLVTLHERREHRSLKFAVKCTSHQTNKRLFPLNPSEDTHCIRNREEYKVNKTHTESYKNSTIPYLQRKLNNHTTELKNSKSSNVNTSKETP